MENWEKWIPYLAIGILIFVLLVYAIIGGPRTCECRGNCNTAAGGSTCCQSSGDKCSKGECNDCNRGLCSKCNSYGFPCGLAAIIVIAVVVIFFVKAKHGLFSTTADADGPSFRNAEPN